MKSGNNYRLANDKAQDLSIKKLTKDNPAAEEEVRGLGVVGTPQWGEIP